MLAFASSIFARGAITGRCSYTTVCACPCTSARNSLSLAADFLLDRSSTLEDVFWGFYHFLDQHPTETLVVSVKVDHGPTDAPVQQALQALFTGTPGADYWITDATVRANTLIHRVAYISCSWARLVLLGARPCCSVAFLSTVKRPPVWI